MRSRRLLSTAAIAYGVVILAVLGVLVLVRTVMVDVGDDRDASLRQAEIEVARQARAYAEAVRAATPAPSDERLDELAAGHDVAVYGIDRSAGLELTVASRAPYGAAPFGVTDLVACYRITFQSPGGPDARHTVTELTACPTTRRTPG